MLLHSRAWMVFRGNQYLDTVSYHSRLTVADDAKVVKLLSIPVTRHSCELYGEDLN